MPVIMYPFSTLSQNVSISSELLENCNVFHSPIIYYSNPTRNVILTLQKHVNKNLMSHSTTHISRICQ